VEIGLLELKMVLKPGRHVAEAEYLKNNAIFPQNTFNGGGWVGGYFAAAQPLLYTLELKLFKIFTSIPILSLHHCTILSLITA
jgi:hypothetical protein